MIFGPVSLCLAVATMALVTSATTVVALREERRSRDMWMFAIGLFGIVLGASLLAVSRWAYDHPHWDQLTEGPDWYRPFSARTLAWSQMLEVWVDHRIVPSRVWSLMIFSLGHVWDNRVQAVWNTVLHSMPVGMLMLFLAPKLKPLERVLVAVALALPAALPLAIQNVTWGFESPFYFLQLFGLLAFWVLTSDRIGWAPLLLGAACLGLCVVSLGSGLLCALALLCTAALESLRVRSTWRGHLRLFAGAALMVAFGLGLGVHRPYETTLPKLAEGVLRALAYPFVTRSWMAVIMWAPGVLWFVALMRQGRRFSHLERFMVALGGFVVLHAIAIGWARSSFSTMPATRYYDVLALGMFFNVLAALQGRNLVLVAWLLVALSGTLWLQYHVIEVELPMWRMLANDRSSSEMRAYLETGDPKQIEWVPHTIGMPRFDREGMCRMLDDPFIRSIMPPSVQPGGSSALPGRLLVAGSVLLSLGLLMGLAAALLPLRHRRPPEASAP